MYCQEIAASKRYIKQIIWLPLESAVDTEVAASKCAKFDFVFRCSSPKNVRSCQITGRMAYCTSSPAVSASSKKGHIEERKLKF